MTQPVPSEAGPSVRVLLTADNSAFTRRAMRVLQEWSEVVVVGSVGNGDEVLARAQELKPDVILIDLAIPDLAGLHMITRLRAMLPQVGIVALTALGLDSQDRAVMAAGADTLVSRAGIRTDLLPAVGMVVQSKAHQRAGSAIEGGRK